MFFLILKRHDLGKIMPHFITIVGSLPKRYDETFMMPTRHHLCTIHHGFLMVEHGGEAHQAREAYMNLPEEKKAALRVFLAVITKRISSG